MQTVLETFKDISASYKPYLERKKKKRNVNLNSYVKIKYLSTQKKTV